MLDIDALGESLMGSPYLLPEEPSELAVLHETLERASALETRCAAVKQRITSELQGLGGQASRTTEIYESNKIEGKRISLAETGEILTREHMWDSASALAHYTLERALSYEPKVLDVVGLAAARILVDQYISERDRPILEADIRDMHSLLFRGHSSAGRYKQYLNEIEGSEHQPVPPVEVPANMNMLVRWLTSSQAPPVWKSAVAHAWLTHIHPFDDGNGRIARLVANFVLGGGCYPPLIVRSTADRPRYIQALGHSDKAGDISPLVRLFVRVLDREIRVMERPGFAWALFQMDLRSREDSIYRRWMTTTEAFFQQVSAHLLTSGLELEIIGSVSPSDFELLVKRDVAGNTWFAKVRRPGDPADLLIWLGYPSSLVARNLENDQIFPAFYLAARDGNPKAIKPYQPEVGGHEARHDEFVIIADERAAVLRRGARASRVGIAAAAELFAALLAEYL